MHACSSAALLALCASLALATACSAPPSVSVPPVIIFGLPDTDADVDDADDAAGDVAPDAAEAPTEDAAVVDVADDDVAEVAKEPDADGPDRPLVRPDDVPMFERGVTTLAGGPEAGWADGLRGDARFDNPVNVAVNPAGDVYVADFGNNAVRKIEPDGWVTTFLRQPGMVAPFGLAFAPDGTLYLETDANDRGGRNFDTGTLWRLRPGERSATVVARDLGRPRGLVVLGDGRLAMSDYARHVIETFDPADGSVAVLAGERGEAGFAEGEGADARFNRPYGMALRGDGSLLVADQGNQRIRVVSAAGVTSTLAGSGARGATNGPGARATFDGPQGVALTPMGVLFVSEAEGHLVRQVSAEGVVTTLAGNRMAAFADGPIGEAAFYGLEGIAVSPDGAILYLPDGNRGTGDPYHRMRRLLLP